MDIKFNTTSSYSGRNGTGICTGVWVDHKVYNPAYPYVSIHPFNSKKSIAAGCFIEIPQSNVGQVCLAMQQDLLDQVLDRVHDRLPTLMGISPELDTEIEKKMRSKPNGGRHELV